MAALDEKLDRCIDKEGSKKEEDLLELFNDLGAYRYCDNAENKGNKDSDEEGTFNLVFSQLELLRLLQVVMR